MPCSTPGYLARTSRDIIRAQFLQSARQLLQQQQRLDELTGQLQRRMQQRLQQAKLQQAHAERQLAQLSPLKTLQQQQHRLQQLQRQLTRAMQQRWQQQQQHWQLLLARLNTVSPLATLSRGYSISFDEQGKVLTDSQYLEIDNEILTKLAHGEFTATVTAINKTSS